MIDQKRHGIFTGLRCILGYLRETIHIDRIHRYARARC